MALVGLGAADAAIKRISTDPSAPGLDELAGGTASFGDIITKDKLGAPSHRLRRAATDRIAILSAPGMATTFEALARSYDHVVISAGAARGPEMEALSELAPQAILLAETVNAATDRARERLFFAGFDDVVILVGARSAAAGARAAAAHSANEPRHCLGRANFRFGKERGKDTVDVGKGRQKIVNETLG